jgi:TRAP-type mannitol/chloroaromatic compound transport system substrate-binding protein
MTKSLKRREIIAGGAAIGAGAAATAGSFPKPAIGQGVTRWRMVTAWPRNLPGPGVAAQMLADRITALSGGRIEVELFATGEIVPGNQVFDAVAEGTAELYHAVPAYWGSKSKGILVFGSQPFGLRADEQVGWLAHGGGQELYDEMYARFGLKPFLCGNSGPQWAGWFRNEITSVDDLQGLRFRTTGLASEMCNKLGMAVQAMGGGDMFQALQAGTIDAGEFIGPWSDSALGFQQVAKNYYWPGVGEPSSAEECAINMSVWEGLEDDLKLAVSTACESLYNPVLTEYTTKHALALRNLVANDGVMVRELPEDVDRRHGQRRGRGDGRAPRGFGRAGAPDHRELPRLPGAHGRVHALRRQRPDERPRARLQLRLTGLLETTAGALDRVNAWVGAPCAGWRSSCCWRSSRSSCCATSSARAISGAPRPSSTCTPPSSCWAPATRSWSTAMSGSTSSTAASGRRGQAWVNLVGTILFLVPTCLVILWFTWRFTANSWAIREGPLSVGGIPAAFLLKSLIPAFAVLLLIQGASLALRSIIRLRQAEAA